MDYSLKLTKGGREPLPSNTEYRKLIGQLLYLANTRPEISFAIGKLSQFVEAPTDVHFKAAIRILKYIKGAPANGIFFPASVNITVTGFSDSDWAACPDTRRSTTAYCFYVGSSIVSWKSKKQTTVAASSAEAEYRELASATREAIWIKKILLDLQLELKQPVSIYCDSQAAIHIASNPVFHERTKHIEVDCHIVRDKVLEKVIHLLPISTREQVADLLTEPLNPGTFFALIGKLGLKNIFTPNLREGVT
ncbi:secreted RxLR effector protein 161-like [Arachis hypogaea]|uniref:secreted RxLR effector protein 161-like n=1 Tax=Arachis hypogaea TaxID=3818 RepID=UPI003B21A566